MEIQTAMLADGARVESGKLYVFGGQWDRIWAQTYPTTHPTLAIVLVLRVEYSEALEDHRIEVYLERDGEAMGPRAEGQLNVGHAPTTKRGAPTFVPIALTFNAVRFEVPGRYEWVAQVEGKVSKRLPLELTHQQRGPNRPQ